jgi:hypothetical protein
MRRRALAEAVRLTGGRPAVHFRGAVALGQAQLSTIPLCVRTAGGPPSASTSSASTSPRRTPLSLGHARPASGLPSRGLACPPHGGVTGDKSRAAATTPTTAPSPDALDPAAEAAYHAAADNTLHALLDGLEAWVDDTPDLGDVDVEYSVSILSCVCVCVCVCGALEFLHTHQPIHFHLSSHPAHLSFNSIHLPVRRPNPGYGSRQGHIRAEQAGPQPPAVALLAGQVKKKGVEEEGLVERPFIFPTSSLSLPRPSLPAAPFGTTLQEANGCTPEMGTAYWTSCGRNWRCWRAWRGRRFEKVCLFFL